MDSYFGLLLWVDIPVLEQAKIFLVSLVQMKTAWAHLERKRRGKKNHSIPDKTIQLSPNQLQITSIDKPQNLMLHQLGHLGSFSSEVFFTSDKYIGIILITLPLKGYSTYRIMPKDDSKYGSASVLAKAKTS